MKLFFVTILSILLTTNIMSQFKIDWEKSLGGSNDDVAESIIQTLDGGYIIAGSTNSSDNDVTSLNGDFDFWIVKLDFQNKIQWKKTFGGSDSDEANSIKQTSDGGYIVAGVTGSSNGNVTFNHGMYDYWVIKLNNSGDIQWQKTFGGSGDDRAKSIQQTTDGGFIVAGTSDSNDGDKSSSHGINDDYWVVKLNNIGNIEWEKSLGGQSTEGLESIQQTNDGGYILAGTTSSADGIYDVTGLHLNNMSEPTADYWIVKLNNVGNIEWQKCLGGSKDDTGRSIKQTLDGGYIVVGESESKNVSHNWGGTDCYIVKLKNNGVIEWDKSIGGSNFDGANDIQQTKDGGYIIAGYTNSYDVFCSNSYNGGTDYYVAKFDNTFTTQLWTVSLGGAKSDMANSIFETLDGGFIIAGDSYSTNGDISSHYGTDGYKDCWIVKLKKYCTPVVTLTKQGFPKVCQGEKVILTTNNNTNYLYEWKKDGIIIVGATDFSYTTNIEGTYSVDVTNESNCKSTTNSVTISMISSTPVSITSNITPTICEGENVILNANIGNGFSYQWKKDDVDIVNSIFSSLTVNESGSYSVVLSNENNCKSNSSPILVNVNPLPEGSISYSSGLCNGTSFTMNAVEEGDNIKYQWKKDGTNIEGATNKSYTATVPGSFSVEITKNNCKKTSSTVDNTCAGINELNETIFNVSPNPTSDYLIVKLNDIKYIDAIYKIYDIYGKEIYNSIIKDLTTKIDLKSICTQGFYVLQINDSIGNSIKNQKILFE